MSFDSNFPLVSLKEVAKFINGDRSTNYPKGADYIPNGIPFISAADLGDEGVDQHKVKRITAAAYERLRSGKIQHKDILFCLRGSIGKMAFVKPKEIGAIASSLVIVRASPQIDSRYLNFLLCSQAGQQAAMSLNNGSAQPNLSVSQLQQIRVPLPTLSEQIEIAVMLGALSDRITLLRETNATLEAIAQALFKSWFVDFDPVRARMEGRAPEGMDEATAALFPDGFEESELGLVPRGWRVLTFAEVFEINPTRKLTKGSMAPYLDMASLATSGHCVEAPIQREMGSGAKFRNGDTLLARITPCLENGKSAFVDFLAEGQTGWGSTEFLVLRPKGPLPEYLGYLLCRHPAFREYAIQSMSGTSGRQRIQNDVLCRHLLAVPGREIALAFGEVIEPIQKSIASNYESAQTLATLRDTLLPRLISGQLRLPEAGLQTQEAAT